MISPMSRLNHGFFAPLEGFRLLFSSRRLVMLSIIPFALGLVFMLIGFALSKAYFFPWVESIYQSAPLISGAGWFSGVLNTFLFILSWLTLALLNFLFAYIGIVIVAGPFYALLAEDIFKIYHPNLVLQNSWGLMIKMAAFGLIKVFFFLAVGLCCFILSFFPGLNLIAAFIVFLIVAFDISDYSFEIDRRGLVQSFAFMGRHVFEYTGLTLAIYLTTFLPGSFFILLPGFVCGATKMYIQLTQKKV